MHNSIIISEMYCPAGNKVLYYHPIEILNLIIYSIRHFSCNVEISGNCSLEVALRLSMYFNRSVNELFYVSDDNPSLCNDRQPFDETEATNG